jgi:phosphatidylglycerophosphate synthase
MPRRWLESWVRWQAALWLPALLGVAVLPCWPAREDLLPAIQGALAGGMALSYGRLVCGLRAGRTVADLLTMARCLTVIGLVAAAPATPGWPTCGLAVLAAAADLVDGALARRFGHSPFGAELDMESDQFTVLGLAVAAVLGGGGPHALVLPAMKYAFVAAAWWLAIPASEPKPQAGDNRRGRLVCAGVVVALLAANCPAVAPPARNVLTAVAAVALAWSFTADARWLWRHRHRGSAR